MLGPLFDEQANVFLNGDGDKSTDLYEKVTTGYGKDMYNLMLMKAIHRLDL